ncbi:bifunctional hydroxymethylpyrimidine kinase/phosphomethylpyrimidine kinase [Caldimonas manganoxidans]|uniref:bifunctional hydroxymethylpyrimidine kinase/phosphomethylpyrimidine kinase n=1 Tax=Caldimonas manganoxidans TaxID=196015 RepID=UPI00037436AF|nr:bifunctional hydroxymethylpyrimidine kinase/phosphomethylpyrimidine kinase [Caldimonas manganoxidans]
MKPPIVWSIAGSDCGGGAGLQADLKAFEAFDVHGCTAVAALTAQHSRAVLRVDAVDADVLEAQLAALAQDLPPRAIKLGLLGSVDNVLCVARWVDRLREQAAVALVLDPVRAASTGAVFAHAALRQAFLDELLPRATLITPNRHEAAWLLDRELRDEHSLPSAARALQALGPGAVAITGGDAGGPWARDWILTPQAEGWLDLPRIDTQHHHGSGCVFAASAAAALAWGHCEADALVLAKMATAEALRRGHPAGQGAGPVRPGGRFASRLANLPRLRQPDWPVDETEGFAPLQRPVLGLYAITDSAEGIERLLAAGVRSLQLRIKRAPDPALREAVRRSVRAAQAVGAQLFINDHWALALEEGAYGVHLGQEDLLALDAQALVALRRAGVRLGLSTHSHWEVCRALTLRPSYIACGPIHPTTTKQMPWMAQGEDNLAYWCQLLDCPVVAIAGMDEARAREAARCGAAGVAVLRGLGQADDLPATVRRLHEAIMEGAWGPRRPAPPRARPSLPGPVS